MKACGLSDTALELYKKQLDGPVLQWKESDTAPFDPEVAQQVQLLSTIGTPGICCKMKMVF